MTVSIFKDAIGQKDLPEEQFFEYLNGMCPELFMPILDNYQGKGVAKTIVLYILYGYSIDSRYKLLQANWSQNKKQIADMVDMPDSVYGDAVELKSKIVRDVIIEYLELQGDFDFKHLKIQQDQYEAISNNMLSTMFDDTGKLLIKEQMEIRKALGDMYNEIHDLRSRIEEKFAVYYENLKELKIEEKPVQQAKLSNPASSPHIKR